MPAVPEVCMDNGAGIAGDMSTDEGAGVVNDQDFNQGL